MKSASLSSGIERGIESFLQHIDQIQDDYWLASGYTHPQPTHRVEYLSAKWAKIITVERRGLNNEQPSQSVYCFICLQDGETKTLGKLQAGDIHMAASWKAPAKHARGSILTADFNNCAGPHGVCYLK